MTAPLVVYDTMVLLQAAQFIDSINAAAMLFSNVPRNFTWPQHPDDDHLFNLSIHAQVKYLVTWETRLLELPRSSAAAAKLLRELGPGLSIVTPRELAEVLKTLNHPTPEVPDKG